MFINHAPTRDKMAIFKPWEGSVVRKPWEYTITAAIPVLDTFDQVEICVELLRLQTVRPFIVIIDTGSTQDELDKIVSLRADDVEVHSLRLNGAMHPSDFPAIAMDLAFSLCRTKNLYATHADVFVRRRDFLEHLISLCDQSSPVVGYEISPRSHEDWKGMVSHTATMYHMETMDKIGFGWSLRRLCNQFGISNYKPDPRRPGWPDTELLGNYIMRQNEITARLIGSEQNFERTLDLNIDHFRSFTSGKLYSHSYYRVVSEWYLDAKKAALERIGEWKGELRP
jgi:hypothetical protein